VSDWPGGGVASRFVVRTGSSTVEFGVASGAAPSTAAGLSPASAAMARSKTGIRPKLWGTRSVGMRRGDDAVGEESVEEGKMPMTWSSRILGGFQKRDIAKMGPGRSS
jgi:hypothetical protein